MVKIQVNSQGKAYYTSGGKVLVAPDGGGDNITATNLTGGTISNGAKVWINKNGNTYTLNSYGQKTRDFTVIGNLNINDTLETASNFSNSNYINIDKTFDFKTFDTWSIEMAFRCTNVMSEQYIFSSGIFNSSNLLRGIRIAITQSGCLTMVWSFDGESVADAWTDTASLQTNWDIVVKVEFDGSKFYIYRNGNLRATINVSSKIATGVKNYIGSFGTGGKPLINGTMLLSDCAIKANGQLLWTPYLHANNENTLTGVALENISAGSSGNVKTIIPEV